MTPAIRVENLGKCYRVAHNQERGGYRTLRDSIVDAVKAPFRRIMRGGQPTGAEDFWALKDVSFEVHPGEVVGIIGRNGAGKSTLLKILSRITKPTKGRIEMNGRVGSLLEVGTGFHPELTGRENICLNGSILGMSKREIDRKFDEIVAFAEIEKFLDTPVKRYSSGMYVRLAFAVAAHLEPEILIVDEVLAVGDTEFQKKCFGKMNEARRGGKTVLFVSHNLTAVRSLCVRGITMEGGRLVCDDEVGKAIAFYASKNTASDGKWIRPISQPLAQLEFVSIECEVRGEQPNLVLFTRLHMRSSGVHGRAFVALDLIDANGGVVLQSVPIATPFIPESSHGEIAKHEVDISTNLPPLIPGNYNISVWCGTHFNRTIEMIENAASFRIDCGPMKSRSFPYSIDHGSISAVSSASYASM